MSPRSVLVATAAFLAPCLVACSLFVDTEALSSGGGPITPGAELDATPDAPPSVPIEAGGPTSTTDAESGAPEARYAKAVRADAPILYLRLGDGEGTVAKSDIGNSGTYTPSGVAPGKPGALKDDPDKAVSFTDGSGRLTVDGVSGFDGFAAFSVEVWAKPSAPNGTIGMIVDHTDWADRRGWDLLVGSDGLAFERWASNSASPAVAGSGPVAVDVWHHVVATFDGTVSRLYVDGVRVAQTTTTIAIPPRTSTLTIAHQGCACGGTTAFLGEVDELAIYDKALTDGQITTHFAAAK